MSILGSYFCRMLPNLKRRRIEYTQFKNELKTKQNTNLKLIIHNIGGIKNIKVIRKDLIS